MIGGSIISKGAFGKASIFISFSRPSESLVEFAHQDQPAIGSNAGTLEIDLERR